MCKRSETSPLGLEQINLIDINSYGKNRFCLWTKQFSNSLLERIKFVSQGITISLNYMVAIK